MEKTQNEKIIEIVKYALENEDGPKLIRLSELFERKGRSANMFKEIMETEG